MEGGQVVGGEGIIMVAGIMVAVIARSMGGICRIRDIGFMGVQGVVLGGCHRGGVVGVGAGVGTMVKDMEGMGVTLVGLMERATAAGGGGPRGGRGGRGHRGYSQY